MDLRFHSNNKDSYDVRMVAGSDSLFLHEYRARSVVNVEAEFEGGAISNESTVEYVHIVGQL